MSLVIRAPHVHDDAAVRAFLRKFPRDGGLETVLVEAPDDPAFPSTTIRRWRQRKSSWAHGSHSALIASAGAVQATWSKAPDCLVGFHVADLE